MPSKHEITRLINKRRKRSLYRCIRSMQSTFIRNSHKPFRTRGSPWIDPPHIKWSIGDSYFYIDPPWVPSSIYRLWFKICIEDGSIVFDEDTHPRDLEWLLSELMP